MLTTNPTTHDYRPPFMEWQTGQYERFARFSFILPYKFLLLCGMVEIPPQKILEDFMATLSGQSTGREEWKIAHKHLKAYFLANGYGQQYYTRKELYQIFTEMNDVKLLLPASNDEEQIRSHVIWRDEYEYHWFHQWYQKPRRLHNLQIVPEHTIEQFKCKVQHQPIAENSDLPSAGSTQP
ncbi:MAG: hypothetical protein J7599_00850 [Niabella sp.]|nr:hypothetical protein [Niabella sp.]